MKNKGKKVGIHGKRSSLAWKKKWACMGKIVGLHGKKKYASYWGKKSTHHTGEKKVRIIFGKKKYAPYLGKNTHHIWEKIRIILGKKHYL